MANVTVLAGSHTGWKWKEETEHYFSFRANLPLAQRHSISQAICPFPVTESVFTVSTCMFVWPVKFSHWATKHGFWPLSGNTLKCQASAFTFLSAPVCCFSALFTFQPEAGWLLLCLCTVFSIMRSLNWFGLSGREVMLKVATHLQLLWCAEIEPRRRQGRSVQERSSVCRGEDFSTYVIFPCGYSYWKVSNNSQLLSWL